MKEVVVNSLPSVEPQQPSVAPFRNKLADQDKSFLNHTFTIDTNKRERQREFKIEDAIRGFLPRARSSDPRRSFKDKTMQASKMVSTSTPIFSTCCLPSLDCSSNNQNKKCQLRPWSRTQEELRKYKQTLNMNRK